MLEVGPNVLSALPDLEAPALPCARAGWFAARGLASRGGTRSRRCCTPWPTGTSSSSPSRRAATVGYYLARSSETAAGRTWTLERPGEPGIAVGDLQVFATDPARSDQVKIVTATVTVFPDDPEAGLPQVWGRLPLDAEHASLRGQGLADPPVRRAAREPELAALGPDRGADDRPRTGSSSSTPCIAVSTDAGRASAARPGSTRSRTPTTASVDVFLDGGDDGIRPGPGAYEGAAARPRRQDRAQAVRGPRGHLDRRRARVDRRDVETRCSGRRRCGDHPVPDLPRRADALPHRGARRPATARTSAQVRAMRAGSTPSTRRSTTRGCGSSTRSPSRRSHLPPSGFVAGIYARNDIERAVYKAPANEVVTLAHRLRDDCSTRRSRRCSTREGINCFRFFEGRGIPALGRAHDQLGPRVEVRQPAPLLRLPRALDRPRHAVGGVRAQRRALWANVRRTIEDFLLQRVVRRRAARRQAGEGVLRQVRPLDDDPERPRQRPAGLPDRRRRAASPPSS